MVKLNTGEEAVQEICEQLRNKTLEPAQEEAREIKRHAEEEAKKILQEAKQTKEAILKEAGQKREEEQVIFHSSLSQAAKQALEELKQQIEHQLFNKELQEMIQKEMVKEDLVAKLLEALIHAIDEEGIATNLKAVISKQTSPEKVNALLGKNILDRLKDKSVLLGEIGAGAEVVLEKKQLKVVMDEKSVLELFTRFLRKDFRKWMFNE